MTKEDAIKLVHLYAKISSQLDQSVALRKDRDPEYESHGGAKPTGLVMGALYCDLMAPLYKRFPDLLPTYLDGPYKIPDEIYQPTFYTSE